MADARFVSLTTFRRSGEPVSTPVWVGRDGGSLVVLTPDIGAQYFRDVAAVVNAGWVPIYNLNLSADVIGYMGAPAIALSYPWTHFICGHLGRLATRDDVALHQAYIADIEASVKEALASVDPMPFYIRYGENFWAGVKAHLDTVTDRAAAPVIAKYAGVLAAADIEVFTRTTTFAIMQSFRLDYGPSGPVHP